MTPEEEDKKAKLAPGNKERQRSRKPQEQNREQEKDDRRLRERQ